jgi:hypothetical protein
LVIEIDGQTHERYATYDRERQAYLEAQGLTVLRFTNHEVLSQAEAVIEAVLGAIQMADTAIPQCASAGLPPPPTPPARGGADPHTKIGH